MTLHSQLLSKAHRLMPHTITCHTSGNILLTLLFVKILSDNWIMQSHMLRAEQRDAADVDTTLARRCVVQMDALSLYDTFRTHDAAKLARATMQAMRNLESINPVLNGVLKPERFLFLQGYFDTVNSGSKLLDIVELIGRVALEDCAPSLACGMAFAEAMQQLSPAILPDAIAFGPLMARLLQPKPDEVIFDPACGQGQLLLACAEPLMAHDPRVQLRLHGLEACPNQFGLATMLLLLTGQREVQLHNVSALSTNLEFQTRTGLAPADVVVTAVPDNRVPWHHALALTDRDKRFPCRPPIDSRLALIWHALASLNPEHGRAVLVVPLALLVSTDSYSVRQYLVEQNLLEAVIDGYGKAQYRLLVIRRNRSQSTVAFISMPTGQAAPAEQDAAITRAYEACQQGARHPLLLQFEKTMVACHQYQFDIHRYGTSLGGLAS